MMARRVRGHAIGVAFIVGLTGTSGLAGAGCAAFQVEQRPFYRPRLDLDEISTAQIREYYFRLNTCRQLRRLAEARAAEARTATGWGTAVSLIGAAVGVVITSIAQAPLLNDNDADTAASVVGLTTAAAGTLSTAIVNLVAPTERSRALIQAGGAARAIEDRANEELVSGKADERAEILDQQVRDLGQQCRDARATITNYYAEEVDAIESTVSDQVDSLIRRGRQQSSVEVLQRIFDRRAREYAPQPLWEPEGAVLSGRVGENASRDISMRVRGGRCYLFLATTGFGWDLDSELLDSSGQVLVRDRETDNHPVVDYCPSADSDVRLRLRQYVPDDESGDRGDAEFRFRTFSRPALASRLSAPDAPAPTP